MTILNVRFLSIFCFFNPMAQSTTVIEKDIFGTYNVPEIGDVSVERYTLKNSFISVQIISYGSTITSIKMPDNNNIISDIVLGFNDMQGYLREDNPYFGATVGRVANRITNGTFVIDQKRYFVTRNIGPHTIHGGKYGFDKKIWNAKILSGSVIMTLESKDNDEGFPGDLFTEITYTLTENNELVIVFKSHTNQPTPVNIVNHSYFNLAGHDKGAEGLYEHEVVINADKYTPLSKEFSLPTGEIKSVDTTEFDLRNKTILGDSIKKTSNGDGFDINLIVNGEGYRQFSKVAHPQSGRYMTVYSDQPGVQFYTSNFLNNVIGKDGQVYNKHAGLCLETQQFPDAVNHVEFPSIILYPNMLYKHTLTFKFGTTGLEKDKVLLN